MAINGGINNMAASNEMAAYQYQSGENESESGSVANGVAMKAAWLGEAKAAAASGGNQPQLMAKIMTWHGGGKYVHGISEMALMAIVNLKNMAAAAAAGSGKSGGVRRLAWRNGSERNAKYLGVSMA